MVAQCPISTARVGATQSRLNGLFTLLAISAFLVAPHPAIPLVLAFDFAARAFAAKPRSPIALASRAVVRRLRLAETMIDAAPKRFAARLGFAFSVAAAAFALAGWSGVARSVAGLFGACAALEAFVGFCVGCQIYAWLPRQGRASEPA